MSTRSEDDEADNEDNLHRDHHESEDEDHGVGADHVNDGMAPVNNVRGHNGRYSPDPIDPIEIDYEPPPSLHEYDLQEDHYYDGDQVVGGTSPALHSSDLSQRMNIRTDNRVQHQHEHSEFNPLHRGHSGGSSMGVDLTEHSRASHSHRQLLSGEDQHATHNSSDNVANISGGRSRATSDYSEEREDQDVGPSWRGDDNQWPVERRLTSTSYDTSERRDSSGSSDQEEIQHNRIDVLDNTDQGIAGATGGQGSVFEDSLTVDQQMDILQSSTDTTLLQHVYDSSRSITFSDAIHLGIAVGGVELFNFPRQYFLTAEREDIELHKDGGFNYCLQCMRDSYFVFDPNDLPSPTSSSMSSLGNGAVSAAVNVLKMLGFNYGPFYVARRMRIPQVDELAPLPEYLISRGAAGTTHCDLIQSIERVTSGQVSGRFFAFFPPREVCLRHWIQFWMQKGAVPVLTLNYQRQHPQSNRTLERSAECAWSHEAIIGVSNKTLHLANGNERINFACLAFYLCSQSHLLVRGEDVTSRFDDDSYLSILSGSHHPLINSVDTVSALDPRWIDMNVLGQVCSLLRCKRRLASAAAAAITPEGQSSEHLMQSHLPAHIAIPHVIQAGVTLFCRRSDSVYQDLVHCDNLKYATSIKPPFFV